ncbi:hypothetical protein [Nonomuraea turcica]|uniref:hypothetical protein n=1 Tax=Nonomuraea sp. G32 TaxID=3067274 RepID=UPI00273C4E04|nr:hypothetical protein [Nonomuraea sp. G32]MDP4510133.1 hypothetical protein [Nonomuraea sp. G32]
MRAADAQCVARVVAYQAAQGLALPSGLAAGAVRVLVVGDETDQVFLDDGYAFMGRPGHVLADTIRDALRNRMLNLLPGKRTALCTLPREVAAFLTHLFELALGRHLRPRIGGLLPASPRPPRRIGHSNDGTSTERSS